MKSVIVSMPTKSCKRIELELSTGAFYGKTGWAPNFKSGNSLVSSNPKEAQRELRCRRERRRPSSPVTVELQERKEFMLRGVRDRLAECTSASAETPTAKMTQLTCVSKTTSLALVGMRS